MQKLKNRNAETEESESVSSTYDSCLWLAGKLETFKAGDVVIFAGGCSHSGAANQGKQCKTNYRLFSYVPTRAFEVPWDFDRCTDKVKVAVRVRV
jgi:hypothetical protein